MWCSGFRLRNYSPYISLIRRTTPSERQRVIGHLKWFYTGNGDRMYKNLIKVRFVSGASPYPMATLYLWHSRPTII